MKEILVILGGDRPKGNTGQLVDSFAQGAADAGHHVEVISLNRMEVKGCVWFHFGQRIRKRCNIRRNRRLRSRMGNQERFLLK